MAIRVKRRWKDLFRYATAPETGSDDPPNLTWSSLRRFFGFIRPHRRIVALLCILTLTNLALSVVMPVAIGRVIDVVLPGQDAGLLQTTALLILGLLSVIALFNYLEREVSVRAGWRVVVDVRKKLHAHLQCMSLRFLENYQVGRLVARVLADTETVRHLLLGGMISGTASLLRFGLIMAVLFTIDWRMTLVSCCTLPFFFVYFSRHILRLRPAYGEMNGDNANLWATTNELFSAARVVKTYGGERRAGSTFVARIHEIMRKALMIDRAQHIMGIFWEISAGAGLVALIWYGGTRVQQGHMTAGDLVAFYALLGQVHGPIAHLIGVFGSVQQSLASLEQIHTILSTPSEIADRANAIQAPSLAGDIRFHHVSFSYRNLKENGKDADPGNHALIDVSFHARPGQCIALVGPSGSGKSTVVNLLARFYDVDAGFITVDGADVRDYRLNTYRRQLAIVLQDTFLFQGTIMENIRYAKPDARDEEVEHAARMAHAMEFINEFPKRFETYCGERGVKLSGGQKQRISIARAVLANPRILILDEATSALDSNSEAQVQAAMNELLPGRTTFVVAHRLSTIMRADSILVLDHGRIIESGTHEQLMEQEGRYFEMFMAQYGRMRGSRRSLLAREA